MRKIVFIICIAFSLSSYSQDEMNTFNAPFDFPLFLSGNFGELRSSHFHGGLDFKTQGAEGKPIHCIGDGYISRVTVSAGGYGNALYVTHNNGYTSVYGHLKSFPPAVAKRVREYQYANETFVVDLMYGSEQFPVKRGEIIGLSGNSGYSFGPHLHLEIRRALTNEPIDPLPFFKNKIKDTQPPRATKLMFYPKAGKGVINGSNQKVTRTLNTARMSNCVNDTLKVFGEIGIGVKANDYMDGTHNSYGVYSVRLLVDGKEYFNSQVNRFDFDENILVNSWADFSEYRAHSQWFIKMFVEPNNPLRMLHTDENKGWITVDKEKIYHVEFILSDIYGNSMRYHFVMKGVEQEIPAFTSQGGNCLHWDMDNEMRDLGMRLLIPKGSLFDDAVLQTKLIDKKDAISYTYSLTEDYCPFKVGCELSIKINYFPVDETSKYYIQKVNKDGTYSMGGTYENGWVKTTINELGTYTVGIDTIPPRVTPIAKEKWKNGVISFSASDSHTGVKSYKGTLDGKFVLFKYSLKNRRLDCDLKAEHISRGKHMLELTVTDYCGNENIIKETINY